MPKCAYGCGQEFVPLRRGQQTARGHQKCYNAQRLHRSADAAAQRDHLNELTEPAGGWAKPAPSPAPIHAHPKGWEPHVEESGNTATAVSQPTENASPDEIELIRGWNLDPAQWRIVGHVNCRRWQTGVAIRDANGKVVDAKTIWLYYYKADLERIDPVRESEIADLIEEIKAHKPNAGSRKPKAGTDDDAFVVAFADVQIGKADGDGTKGTVARALAGIDSVERRVAELRAAGRKIGTLYVLGMGDLIENCSEHYPQQAFRVELNRRDQVKVMRRIVVKSLERWAPLFKRVVVAAVGGNHGENRREGKSFTDFADNDDVAIFEQTQEVLAANRKAYGHVSFVIPNDELSMTLDMGGEIVGITHGHLFGKGSGPVAKKAMDWWMKQAHGQQPVGDARILISAHFHHLIVNESGAKTHIQCPTLEGGSDWWRNQSGQHSRPGLLTLRVGKNVSPSGWADLEIV